MSIELSAIICTYNRADYLRKSLKSLTQQTLPVERFEIIVVDNNSNDDTRKVTLEEYAAVPNLRYLFEPVPGLSRARNTGWQNAAGRFIAFLDDDAVAAPQWAETFLEVFTTWEPMPGCAGGKAEPIWEVPQPNWLSDRLLPILSVYDWSPQPIVLSQRQWIAGCNIAYPRAVLEQCGGFREDLGRVGKKLLSGEEIYLRKQIDAAGYVTVYHPDIKIGHHVSPTRLQKDWFRRHAFGTGQTAVIMDRLTKPDQMGNRLLVSLRKVGWIIPRAVIMLLTPDPAKRFRREYQLREVAGYVAALWR